MEEYKIDRQKERVNLINFVLSLSENVATAGKASIM